MVGLEFNDSSDSICALSKKSDKPVPKNIHSRVQAKCYEAGLMLLTTSIYPVSFFFAIPSTFRRVVWLPADSFFSAPLVSFRSFDSSPLSSSRRSRWRPLLRSSRRLSRRSRWRVDLLPSFSPSPSLPLISFSFLLLGLSRISHLTSSFQHHLFFLGPALYRGFQSAAAFV